MSYARLIELLIRLDALYEEGLMASEFDKEINKMTTPAAIDQIFKDIKEILPDKLKPMEAATRMRDLPEQDRIEAIEDAGDNKVADLRREFQAKMSANKGARGLVEQFVANIDDPEKLNELIYTMKEFVDASKV